MVMSLSQDSWKWFVVLIQSCSNRVLVLYPRTKMKKKVQTSLGTVTASKDHPLQSQNHFRQSSYLQELAIYIGQSQVFDEASESLFRIGGISLSDKTIERLCHHYGDLIEESWVDSPLAAPDSHLHYAMVDGSMVLTREEKWKEMKLGRVYAAGDQMAQSEARNMVKQSNYTAHLGDHQAFFEKFFDQVAHLTNLVFICDGARWIWNWIDDYFPDSIQILDWYHLIEKISQFALTVFPNRAQAVQWIEQQEQLLWEDQFLQCIDNIEELKLKTTNDQLRRKLLVYMNNNQKRMRYKTFRQQGLSIGSGPIESANRQVIQKRLKLSGQRWTKDGAQQVANLRTVFMGKQATKIKQIVRKAA